MPGAAQFERRSLNCLPDGHGARRTASLQSCAWAVLSACRLRSPGATPPQAPVSKRERLQRLPCWAMKLLFAPISIVSGRIAGLTARKLTDGIWGAVEHGQPPRPDQQAAPWSKLAARLALEGAVFAVVSGLADHAARRWFEGFTGRWPGERDEQAAEARQA